MMVALRLKTNLSYKALCKVREVKEKLRTEVQGRKRAMRWMSSVGRASMEQMCASIRAVSMVLN
jgi:hypothetical protein